MGYYIAIMSVFYVIAALLCPIFFAKVPRKLQFASSMLISSLALGMMGNSGILEFPTRNLNLVLGGMALLGFV